MTHLLEAIGDGLQTPSDFKRLVCLFSMSQSFSINIKYKQCGERSMNFYGNLHRLLETKLAPVFHERGDYFHVILVDAVSWHVVQTMSHFGHGLLSSASIKDLQP